MKEQEIRPQKLLQEYVKLSKNDVKKFSTKTRFKEIKCPACRKKILNIAFRKNIFSYKECPTCKSLFLSPRPLAKDLFKFYKDSQSEKYWAKTFFPAVAEVRRKSIFRPRVKKISALLDIHKKKVKKIVDVGAGFGIFLEEWREKFPTCKCVAIEPSRSMAQQCRKRGLDVLETTLEKVPQAQNETADLITCFEVLEHVHDPDKFIKCLLRLVRPGGYILLTSLCIDGFDLQVLWNRSYQIMPPHHINFFSKQGLKKICLRNNVSASILTPGRLDTDIVWNYATKHPNIFKRQPVLKIILDNLRLRKAVQNLLVAHRLSSHVWIFGKKMRKK